MVEVESAPIDDVVEDRVDVARVGVLARAGGREGEAEDVVSACRMMCV